MKKIFKTLGLTTLSMILMACGNDAGENNDVNNETSGDSGGETLLIMLSEEPTEEDALAQALSRWAEESGNNVERLVVPYDDQISSFRSMVQNNDAPDLVVTTRLTRLYPEAFQDLSDVVEREIFDPTALEVISQDDELSSRMLLAPRQYTTTVWFYNADAFEQAGIEAPTEGAEWTLDELYENAQLIQENSDVNYGLAVDFSRARYDNFMYSNGGSITTRDGDEILVNTNSDENIETLDTFVQKNEEGILPQVVWAGGSADNPADYFMNGDVAIYHSGTWNYAPITENSDFEFAVMPSPMGTTQKSVIPGGEGFGIPESAENAALAEEFITWFYEEENFSEYMNNDLGVNFLEGIEVEYDDEKVAEDFALIQNEIQFVTDEYLADHSSRWTNYLDNEYRDYLRRAVAGELTAEEALNSFAEDLSDTSEWEINQ